jgi:amino acid permease
LEEMLEDELERSCSESGTPSEMPEMDDDFSISVPVAVPDNIPGWKRNVFRVILVAITAMLAMLLKDYFFYVGAFTGSVGSVLLAYVMPCYFHLRLCPGELTGFVYFKDVAIMVFGVLAGLAGLYALFIAPFI